MDTTDNLLRVCHELWQRQVRGRECIPGHPVAFSLVGTILKRSVYKLVQCDEFVHRSIECSSARLTVKAKQSKLSTFRQHERGRRRSSPVNLPLDAPRRTFSPREKKGAQSGSGTPTCTMAKMQKCKKS
ncbi:MAG: hypothetical protein ACPIOQ_63445, partial [Promethearchaeia archaeon]